MYDFASFTLRNEPSEARFLPLGERKEILSIGEKEQKQRYQDQVRKALPSLSVSGLGLKEVDVLGEGTLLGRDEEGRPRYLLKTLKQFADPRIGSYLQVVQAPFLPSCLGLLPTTKGVALRDRGELQQGGRLNPLEGREQKPQGKIKESLVFAWAPGWPLSTVLTGQGPFLGLLQDLAGNRWTTEAGRVAYRKAFFRPLLFELAEGLRTLPLLEEVGSGRPLHLDIKPSNLIFIPDKEPGSGHLVLVDWASALLWRPDQVEGGLGPQTMTPAFASIDQFFRGVLTGREDQRALILSWISLSLGRDLSRLTLQDFRSFRENLEEKDRSFYNRLTKDES